MAEYSKVCVYFAPGLTGVAVKQGGETMKTYTGDQGKGSLGNILFLLLVLALVYFGFKFIPVRIHAFSFMDAMIEEASFAAHRNDKVIKGNLLRFAREYKLPISKEQIELKREPGRMTVLADYTVVVDTIFFTYDWNFKEKVVREIY
jgi:hypothetical protein